MSSSRPFPHWLKITVVVVGIFFALTILVRLVGSPIATSVVNRKLAALPGYPGHVKGVQLALWRGKITATGFSLIKAGREQDGPLLKIEKGSFTLGPAALLQGRIAGRIALHGVEVLMIQEAKNTPDTPDKPEEKSAKKENREQAGRAWQKLLQESFPVELTRFEASDVQVKFVDHSHAAKSEMLLEKMHVLAHDFRTRPTSSNDLPARLEVDGHFHGGGDLAVRASADATSAQPLFKATMEIRSMALPPMNEFLKAYALVDVSRGTFELYSEVNAKGGHYNGYLKPFFKNLEFSAVPDPDKNLLQRAAVKLASTAQNLLKSDEGKVATKAPFEGDFADNKVDVWTTVENLLRNAFVASLREGFENQKPTG